MTEQSKPRALMYAFCVAVLGVIVYYYDFKPGELDAWLTAIGAAIPTFGLLVAFIKTWPRMSRQEKAELAHEKRMDKEYGPIVESHSDTTE